MWVREPKGIGRCRMAVLDDASAGALEPFVTGSIQPGARVITDGWAGYSCLGGLGYVHERRSQRAARARGEDPGGPDRCLGIRRTRLIKIFFRTDRGGSPAARCAVPGGGAPRGSGTQFLDAAAGQPGLALVRAWLAGGGAIRALRRPGPCERAGQRVQQQVAGPEVGGAGPDVPAGDEFQRGPRGRGGPVVGLQPHPQRRAQRPAGKVDLDLAGPAVPVVLGRSADQALAGAPSAVVRGDLPAFEGGHACSERDVHDPPERQPGPGRAAGRGRRSCRVPSSG